jgi:hypothetical protein
MSKGFPGATFDVSEAWTLAAKGLIEKLPHSKSLRNSRQIRYPLGRRPIAISADPTSWHQLFFSQVEYCDNLIFRRRAALDQLGDRRRRAEACGLSAL